MNGTFILIVIVLPLVFVMLMSYIGCRVFYPRQHMRIDVAGHEWRVKKGSIPFINWHRYYLSTYGSWSLVTDKDKFMSDYRPKLRWKKIPYSKYLRERRYYYICLIVFIMFNNAITMLLHFPS